MQSTRTWRSWGTDKHFQSRCVHPFSRVPITSRKMPPPFPSPFPTPSPCPSQLSPPQTAYLILQAPQPYSNMGWEEESWRWMALELGPVCLWSPDVIFKFPIVYIDEEGWGHASRALTLWLKETTSFLSIIFLSARPRILRLAFSSMAACSVTMVE